MFNLVNFGNCMLACAVEVRDGFIASVVKAEDWMGSSDQVEVIDFGEAVVMPGLIDV